MENFLIVQAVPEEAKRFNGKRTEKATTKNTDFERSDEEDETKNVCRKPIVYS